MKKTRKLRKKIILGTGIISIGVISPMLIQLNTHKTTNVKPALKSIANMNSNGSNHYKYVKNGDSSKSHDNFEYTLTIGRSDINYWYASHFYASLGEETLYEHKVHTASGYVWTSEKIQLQKEDLLEYYFNSAGAYEWEFTPEAPRFISQFDKDMNGTESVMFSSDSIMLPISLTSIWTNAYDNNKSIVINYETWYTDVFHIGMSATMNMHVLN